MESRKVLVLVFLLSLFALNVSAINKNEAFQLYLKARQSKSGVQTAGFQEGYDRETPAVQVQSQKGLKEKDRIHRLPGQPPVKFKQYGGYITVDASSGRAFFYYFVEAEQNPEKAPLALWLNGGPGCSSLGYGAMEELGPFRVGSDGKTLFKNEFSWNKVANMLFLESPAGVGFSYSNITKENHRNGDSTTAADNLVFLLNWFERFPEYKTRDFFLTGESYAGHYVPQLAHSILKHNRKAKNKVNLKAITIGNAAINDQTDNMGMYEYWESHALISKETLQSIKKECDFDPNAPYTDECINLINSAGNLYKEINVYDIYYPRCMKSIEGKNVLTPKPKPFSVTDYDPCGDDYTAAYLNRPEVQAAMHANVSGVIEYPWSGCSPDLIRNWTDWQTSMLPTLKHLMNHGIRVLKYSGDIDGRVPVTATLQSLAAINVSIIRPWSPWYLAGEVGGFTQYYEGNLIFTSVRGAGHEVPSYQPERALSLFNHFLTATPLPDH